MPTSTEFSTSSTRSKLAAGRGRPKITPPTEEYQELLHSSLALIHNREQCPASVILDEICHGRESMFEGWFGENGNFVRGGLIRRTVSGEPVADPKAERPFVLTQRGNLMLQVVELSPTAELAADRVGAPNTARGDDAALVMAQDGLRLLHVAIMRLARRPSETEEDSSKKTV